MSHKELIDPPPPSIELNWKRCITYEEATNYSGCIYLHQWDGKPFYWGKIDKSWFGGDGRFNERLGKVVTARYDQGYRHWIEGCLQHGGKLYIGVLEVEGIGRIDDVEDYLIFCYPSKMNKRIPKSKPSLVLKYVGEVPTSLDVQGLPLSE